MRRRALLQGFIGLGACFGPHLITEAQAVGAQPESKNFKIVLIDVKGVVASRAALLIPSGKSAHPRRLVVLLHGKGESGDPNLGVLAWTKLYGLASSYDRLCQAPVVALGKRREWTDARLQQVNAALARTPFDRPLVLCPFTPNLLAMDGARAKLESYGDWLLGPLLDRVETHGVFDRANVRIEGCSMGGPIAIHLFSRRPQAFAGVGMVQGAVGEGRAASLASTVLAAKPKSEQRICLLTSSGDPFLKGNRALASALKAQGLKPQLREIPGPHDQPWLREAGTIETLLFHDASLDARG